MKSKQIVVIRLADGQGNWGMGRAFPADKRTVNILREAARMIRGQLRRCTYTLVSDEIAEDFSKQR